MTLELSASPVLNVLMTIHGGYGWTEWNSAVYVNSA